jgi:hypothetical protein
MCEQRIFRVRLLHFWSFHGKPIWCSGVV